MRATFNDIIRREPKRPSAQYLQAKQVQMNRNRKKQLEKLFDSKPSPDEGGEEARSTLHRNTSLDSGSSLATLDKR